VLEQRQQARACGRLQSVALRELLDALGDAHAARRIRAM
jgi:hypothetical protein